MAPVTVPLIGERETLFLAASVHFERECGRVPLFGIEMLF
jgi:hypothetical protein